MSTEPASAVAACDRFIKLHPTHPAVDYAYYLKGLISFNEDLGWAGYISTQDPTERDPMITCNLWSGWPTTPRRGTCDKLLELLRYMCSGESNPEALYQWVLR